MKSYILECDHSRIDESNVVDSVGNKPRLVVEGLGVTYVVANTNAPCKKKYFP